MTIPYVDPETHGPKSNEIRYAAQGIAGEVFPVPFIFFRTTDLHVFDNGTKQALGPIYNVFGAGNPAGGSVVWVGTTTAGNEIRIVRIVKPEQATDYSLTGKLNMETVEQDFDKRAIVDQQCLRRDLDDASVWRAENDIIRDVKDPVEDQDAATKAWVNSQISGSGSGGGSGIVPSPGAGDVDDVLTATGAGTADWRDRGVKGAIVPSQIGKSRVVTATGDGNHDWHTPMHARNLIVNGDFRVAQRGTSFDSTTTPANDDDTYLLDRWILLSDGDDRADVAQDLYVSGALASDMFAAIKLTGATLSSPSQKFGILQILEAEDSIPLSEKVLSLSFKAKTTGSTVRHLRAAILSWEGTANVPTSDVVSAWEAEGSDPTMVADWVCINTPSNLTLSDTWQTFKIEGITMPDDVVNAAIFIWVDDTDLITGNAFWVANVQLAISDIAHEFNQRAMDQELSLCERFFNKSYDLNKAPGASDIEGSIAFEAVGTGGRTTVRFPRRMRSSPTVTLWDWQGDLNKAERADGALECTIALGEDGQTGFTIDYSLASDGNSYQFHYTAEAEL